MVSIAFKKAKNSALLLRTQDFWIYSGEKKKVFKVLFL